MLVVQGHVNDVLVAEYVVGGLWYARWTMLIWRRNRSVVMQSFVATMRKVAPRGTAILYGYGDAGFAATGRGEQSVPTTSRRYLLHR